METFKYILRAITTLVVALFICGVDSIYDNNQMVYWILTIIFFGSLTYKFAR